MTEGKGFTEDPNAGAESEAAAADEGDSGTPLAHDRRDLFKKAGLVAAGAAGGVLGAGVGAALISEDRTDNLTSVGPAARGCEVDVADFGAIGDGVADDTSGIQDALASLVGGGTVCFPPGLYRTTSTITWPNDVDGLSLVGAGAGASRIWFDFGDEPETEETGRGIHIDGPPGRYLSDIRLQGLTFQGGGNFPRRADDPACYELVTISGNVKRVVVRDCTFKWARHSGLRFHSDPGIDDVVITSCRFEEINTGSITTPLEGGGILGFHVNQIRVTDCLFSDIGLDDSPPHFHALYLGHCSDSIVRGCVFDGSKNKNTRLTMSDEMENSTVTGNTFLGQDVNYFLGGEGSTFIGNTLLETQLAVGGEGVVVSSNTFRWVTLGGRDEAGIGGSMLHGSAGGGGQGLVIAGNTFTYAGTADYAVDTWALRHDNPLAANWLITGNTFTNLRVWFLAASSGHVFSNNYIIAPDHANDLVNSLVHFGEGAERMVVTGNVILTGHEGLVFTARFNDPIFQGNFFQGGGVNYLAEGHVIPGE